MESEKRKFLEHRHFSSQTPFRPILLSALDNSEIPHPNQIPADLIPYYLKTENETSVFYQLSDWPDMIEFPSPIIYNFESKTWNSIYTNKLFKDWTSLETLKEALSHRWLSGSFFSFWLLALIGLDKNESETDQ